MFDKMKSFAGYGAALVLLGQIAAAYYPHLYAPFCGGV